MVLIKRIFLVKSRVFQKKIRNFLKLNWHGTGCRFCAKKNSPPKKNHKTFGEEKL
tara:strand:- start:434 stop:598 length:165 start_codon:yes stop_codon:yes gene_type:complete